eukprot:6936925-Lingulodinium_polyedra.AAC.1
MGCTVRGRGSTFSGAKGGAMWQAPVLRARATTAMPKPSAKGKVELATGRLSPCLKVAALGR